MPQVSNAARLGPTILALHKLWAGTLYDFNFQQCLKLSLSFHAPYMWQLNSLGFNGQWVFDVGIRCPAYRLRC